MKKCTKCKEFKAFNEFGKKNSTKDKLQENCKSCNKIIFNIRKDLINKNRKINRNNNKETALEYARNYRKLNIVKLKFNNYIRDAIKRDYIFQLTLDQFEQLIKQPCHYCNQIGGEYLNGIDRKDNTKGYTLDNCLPCCGICNQAKMDISYEDFKQWVQRISNHFLNK